MKAIKYVVLLCLLSILFASGCDSRKPTADQSNGTARRDKVRIILSWTPSAEHAFLYYGIKRGFFRDVGLDVEVQPSGGSSQVAKALEGGSATFGFIGGDVLVISRIAGARIRALATLFHTSPASIYSLKETGINAPLDLRNKRIGVLKQSTTYPQYLLLLKKHGIDPASIVEVPSTGSPQELLSGHVQAAMHYTQYTPLTLKTQGHDIAELLLKDWGVDVVSTSLATMDHTIESQQKMVAAFVEAFLRSLSASRENSEEALAALLEAEASLNPEATRAALRLVNEMIFTSEANKLGPGYLSLDDWQRTQKTLLDGGQIKTPINPQYFFDDQFVTQYAEKSRR